MRSSRFVRRVRGAMRPLLERLEAHVNPGFVAPLAFDAGSLPQSVAVGDFNGDGVLDLAVSPGTVRVLLGNGDGTFQPFPASHVSYSVGDSVAVAVADLDGDGWLDAVTANFSSNDVAILLNDGAWTGPSPGGSPGPGGGRGRSAPDLFLGEELARALGSPAPRQAAPEAVASAGPRQAAAPVLRDLDGMPGRTAGTSPAARRDRAQAARDLLFTPLGEYGLPLGPS